MRVANPDDATGIAKAVDEGFANSPFETRTDTEKAFASSWVKQMGNIQLLLMTVGSVVFFTLLLVTGNTMAIAVRERTRELAVLKAVGFSDGSVLALVIAKTMVVAVAGGGIGLGLAKLFTLRGDPTGGLLPLFYLSDDAIALGLALALAVGVTRGPLACSLRCCRSRAASRPRWSPRAHREMQSSAGPARRARWTAVS